MEKEFEFNVRVYFVNGKDYSYRISLTGVDRDSARERLMDTMGSSRTMRATFKNTKRPLMVNLTNALYWVFED